MANRKIVQGRRTDVMKWRLSVCSETEEAGLFIVELDCSPALFMFYRLTGMVTVRLIFRGDARRVVLCLVREYEPGVLECFFDEKGVEQERVIEDCRWEVVFRLEALRE